MKENNIKVDYKKDLRHNYMVISGETGGGEEHFSIKMLRAKGFEGALSLEQRSIDNLVFYYYDITAKQAINNLLERMAITHDKLKRLLLSIVETVENAYEYLLNENSFILKPEMIYMDLSTEQVYLCYLPGYQTNIMDQMGSLMEYFMNKVDYCDKEAVLLVYNIYSIGKGEGFTFDHMVKIINSNNPPSSSSPSRINNNELNSKLNKIEKQTLSDDEEKMKADAKIQLQSKEEPVKKRKINTTQPPFMVEKITSEEEILCYPRSSYVYSVLSGVVVLILMWLSVKEKLIYTSLGNRIDMSKLAAFALILFCGEGYLLSKIWCKKRRVSKIVAKQEYMDPRTEIVFNYEEEKESIWRRLLKGEWRGIFSSKHRNNNELSNTGKREPVSREFKKNDVENKYEEPEQESLYEIYDKGNGTVNGIKKERNDECHNYVHGINLNEGDEVSNPTCLLSYVEPSNDCYLRPVDEKIYETIILDSFPFLIGTLKKHVDYCLEKEVVSRYHAKITKDQEQYYITDLNSTNGTFLNSVALSTYQPRELEDGDEVAFANIRYRFVVHKTEV